MMNLLEPVVFEIQRHAPYATDPIPTEIAQTPRASKIVSGILGAVAFWARYPSCQHCVPPAQGFRA